MSLLRANNFGWLTAAQLTRAYATVDDGSGSILVGSYGRASAPGIRFAGDAAAYIRDTMTVSVPSGAVAIIQTDLRISAAPAAVTALFRIVSGSTVQATLAIGTDRKLQVYRGDLTTALGSASTYVVPVNTFISIGLQLTIDNSTGAALVHVWAPGDTTAQVVLNLTGQDTQATGAATWDGYDLHAGNAGNTDWTNLIVADGSGGVNDALFGPADVVVRKPNGAGASSDWTPSSGLLNYAMVDDPTADDSVTLIEADSVNLIDVYEFEDVPNPDQAVIGSVLMLMGQNAGGSEEIAPVARQSGSNTVGTAFALAVAMTAFMTPYDAAPDATPWTPAIWNAMSWGLKRTA